MHRPSRRRFLASTTAAAAATMWLPTRRVLGANETINVGVIGLGGRGAGLAGNFAKVPGVRIAAVCDADSANFDKVKKVADARTETDLRKILDDKNIDAVVIATCNHWHALASIWACQAGKDVYVEKPVSQTIWEGRRMVEAARKYKRVVQGGTQQRSCISHAKMQAFIKSGKLGKMLWIRSNRFGPRASIGKLDKPLVPPSTCDYNLWLGPAQDLPMYREKFHYDWHWAWNTGSGEMGNWGVHLLDDVRNILQDRSSLPLRVMAGGGRVAWNDAGETPNVHVAYFDTGVVPVIFSLSNLPIKPGSTAAPHYRGIRSGYIVQFENGYIAGGRGGGFAYDKDGAKLEQFAGDGGGAHVANFIAAVRSRDNSALKAEIEQTHYSSAWCHLANIAFRLGTNYSKEAATSLAKDFQPWQELIEQFNGHMAANDIDLAKGGLKLSPVLEIDPKKETFTGPAATPAALALLTREYRKGFAVPETV